LFVHVMSFPAEICSRPPVAAVPPAVEGLPATPEDTGRNRARQPVHKQAFCRIYRQFEGQT
jgi:hypothetical protein